MNFKRSRNDTTVGRMYPNAVSLAIARGDVSNKNLLKNPFNNKTGPVDDHGERPWGKKTDNFGNVFAQSTVIGPSGITNSKLLQNPWRFREDPVDTPRTLSRQTIRNINDGKYPKFIRQDKGVDEVAFTVLSFLPDTVAKIITMEMLKSIITGNKLTSLGDKGAHHITRAFLIFYKLLDDVRKIYNEGLLATNMSELIRVYLNGLVEIFGPYVMDPVTQTQIQLALTQLGNLSGILSRMFREQNALDPTRLVPYETIMNLPPNPSPPIPTNLGDNDPNPPQNVKDPDIVRDQNDPNTPANQLNPTPTPNTGKAVPPYIPGGHPSLSNTRNIINLGLMGAAAIGIGNIATKIIRGSYLSRDPIEAVPGVVVEAGIVNGNAGIDQARAAAAQSWGSRNAPAPAPPSPGLGPRGIDVVGSNGGIVRAIPRNQAQDYATVLPGDYADAAPIPQEVRPGMPDSSIVESFMERAHPDLSGLQPPVPTRPYPPPPPIPTRPKPPTQAGPAPTQAGPAQQPGNKPRASRFELIDRVIPNAAVAYPVVRNKKEILDRILREMKAMHDVLPDTPAEQRIVIEQFKANKDFQVKSYPPEAAADIIAAAISADRASRATHFANLRQKAEVVAGIDIEEPQQVVPKPPPPPGSRRARRPMRAEGRSRKKTKTKKNIIKKSKNIDSQILALLKG